MTTKLNLFNPYSVDDQALLLAAHLPVGRVWQKGFDPSSNIGKYFLGLSLEFYRFQVLVKEAESEMDINQANDLLIEWEKSVGLPDSCFSIDVSDEERRKQILQKFSRFGGAQTADDFVRIALVFGINTIVHAGLGLGGFPLQFPLMFFDTTKSAGHTIVVIIQGQVTGDAYFPLPFPMPFSSGSTTFLECIFNKLAPANVNVLVLDEGDL